MTEISPRQWLASVISTAEADGNPGLADVARRTLAELHQPGPAEHVVVTVYPKPPPGAIVHVYARPLDEPQDRAGATALMRAVERDDPSGQLPREPQLPIRVSTHRIIRTRLDGTVIR